jgi:hypothetical protein
LIDTIASRACSCSDTSNLHNHSERQGVLVMTHLATRQDTALVESLLGLLDLPVH